ncbi:MAG: ileS [Candidatus Levybacteria bacterium]|nr:ileS [Candidatus Levybacteria bacterium]
MKKTNIDNQDKTIRNNEVSLGVGFKPVKQNVNFPELEKEILESWKKNKIFEKSVAKKAPKGKWTFLDGPPFITGLPHYGSLLSSLPKDLFPRYKTMQGYSVRRVWGWDCHGLPAENKVEEKLGLKSKKEIVEKVGIKKFIDECKNYVKDVSSEWEWYIDHIARWVDFKNAYRTMDLPYMESVMWVFKQMYDKGYIYKGLRVSLYCPHCATPISNFEVAMDADNHKEVPDAATTYKYQLKDEKNTYILAWSTTPWTKIATPALAVNPKLIYVKVEQNGENYILAKTTVKILIGKYKILEEFKGEKLIGQKFVPHYDYYRIEKGKKAFEIIGGDFVTADEGTGVVTIAVYGQEDLKAMNENNIHIEMPVDEDGSIKPDVPQFGGLYYLKANKAVNEDLETRKLIYKDEEITHSVPLCWRCHTRLYYAPQDAWYVNVQDLKIKMKKSNELVNWFPGHFKHGRFLKSLESAPDWNISRSRFWGSPVPVWECACGERFIPGSIKELEERSGMEIKDLHKPEIDEVTVKCAKCAKTAKRVPEVLDSWIEAGSASFGERHYPFEGKEKIEDFYPPDFIGEYTGQIRAWFYVMHVIANALDLRKDGLNILSKNVLVEGVILGTDGRKMSKNYGNYPDPKEMIDKYGGDALRLYLLGSPVMNGEDILIAEEPYRSQVRGTLLILWNVYNFFVSNALIDKWSPTGKNEKSGNVLDKWILSRLNGNIKNITQKGYEVFNAPEVVGQALIFINDLSLWYLRRSRSRVGPAATDQKDKNNFYSTLWDALKDYSKALAPLIPFITEEIYKNLTGETSVHLADFPIANMKLHDDNLEKEMHLARKIVEMAHSKRKEAMIKVRQPLSELKVTNSELIIRNEIIEIIKDEINVKKIVFAKGAGEMSVALDVTLTEELKKEGEARDIVRMIQGERKKLGTTLDEKVNVVLQDWPKEFEEEIKKKAMVANLSKGENFQVTRKPRTDNPALEPFNSSLSASPLSPRSNKPGVVVRGK